MKAARPLAAALALMFVVAFIPSPTSAAAPKPYTESLTAYVAGSNALWFMTFGGVNASGSRIAAAEAPPGVLGYNLTVIKTSGWSTDFQAFGPNGYNLLPVPFVPPQGAFITVAAGTYDEAAFVSSKFGLYLLTSFVSYSNGTGSFTFFAPLAFSSVVPSTLLELLPSNMGGFASALTASAFASSKSPILVLQGTRVGTVFQHNLILGSITGGALDSAGRPNILKYFGTTVGYISASNRSSSSSISIRLLDGGLNATDSAAAWANHETSGTYALPLAQGQKVFRLNATVVQLPSVLLAQRIADTGVLKQGQNISVTISMSNPSGTRNVTVPSFADQWWNSSEFQLVKGSATIPAQNLAPQGSASPTYVLKYTGTLARQTAIPPLTIPYRYKVGAAVFRGAATTNAVPLSLGTDSPDVYAYVSYSSAGTNFGGAVGSTEHFTIVVKNIGTLTASSLVVAGQAKGGLAPRGLTGDSVTVAVPVTAPGITTANYTRAFLASYSTPGGQTVDVATNPIAVAFSRNSMAIGFPSMNLVGLASALSGGKVNLTLSISVSNQGSANLTGFLSTERLPAGLACGRAVGTGLTCDSGTASLSIPNLAQAGSWQGSLQFNLTTPLNYYFAPMPFHTAAGVNLTGTSDGAGAPSGLVLTKDFSPSVLFGGMTSTATIRALNRGPYDVFNSTLTTTADPFDTLASTAGAPAKSAQDIATGGNLTAVYTVNVKSATGNLTASGTALSFYFFGVPYSTNQTGSYVSVYSPVSVSIATSPAAPTEGRAFSLALTITNPSNVTVTGVSFALPIPRAMSLSGISSGSYSGGTLTVTAASLGPHKSLVSNMSAQASSGITLLLSSGTLTFSYSGTTIPGRVPSKSVVVAEDVFTRYTLPTLVVLVGVLAAAFYVRSRAGAIAPASR